MRRRKIVALAALIAVVSMALWAGGNKENAPAESNQKKKTNLVFVHMFGPGTMANFINQIIQDYQKAYPNITVESRYIPFDSLNKQLSIYIASNQIPDLVFTNNPDFGAFVKMGLYADISDRIKAWDESKQFYKIPLEAGIIDGKIYGLTFDTNCLALFFNKDMLTAKGVAPPATMDELAAAAAKLTDKPKNVYGLAMSAINGLEGTFQFIPFLVSFGGSWDKVNSAAGKKALQFIVDLVNNGSMSKEIVTFGQGSVNDRFAAGQAAMMINGTWQLSNLRNKKTYPSLFNWDVVTIPKGPAGSFSVMGGKIIGCGKTENLEASFNFMKMLCSKDNMLAMAKAVGAVPNRSDVAADPFWKIDPQMEVFVKQMETTVPRGPHQQWPGVDIAISTAIGEAVSGTKTVEAALNDAQAKIDLLLKK
jgi:multiple sugar transport system substrate-binding protein